VRVAAEWRAAIDRRQLMWCRPIVIVMSASLPRCGGRIPAAGFSSGSPQFARGVLLGGFR
jgi:hypothetical protein